MKSPHLSPRLKAQSSLSANISTRAGLFSAALLRKGRRAGSLGPWRALLLAAMMSAALLFSGSFSGQVAASKGEPPALEPGLAYSLQSAGYKLVYKTAGEPPKLVPTGTPDLAPAPLSAQAGGRTDIAGPVGSGAFGTQVVTLPNGNFVVTDPTYDEGGVTDIGAVYLYNGATLELISTLKGVTASDNVGNSTIIVLTGGSHFVVVSPNWDKPSPLTTNVGAVTLCSATVGCNGTVTEANSLVGATTNDFSSAAVTALTSGNYLVRTPFWDNTSPAVADAGAATFCNAATNSCANQTVSAVISLVGTTAFDNVGNSFTTLANGNFFIRSTFWDNGTAPNAGAVTFCSGTTGCPNGAVSAANSLVGSSNSDTIGGTNPTILSSGNVVFPATAWDNAGVVNAGAVTFCSNTSGCPVGAVSAANSLVGTTASDNVGLAVTSLPAIGNYVVRSTLWNGAAADVGAVTFCSGTTGCTGNVSSANSLVGTTVGDQISSGFLVLTNGNYVVLSPSWDGAGASDAGAATFCSGTTGCAPGAVSAANSLVGTTASDNVGSGGLALTNGNYIVRSPSWDNTAPAIANAGAVTMCSGTTGCAGAVTAANSLTGGAADNLVGNAVGAALANGNYVVGSSVWDNGATLNVGAATLCSGVTNNCAGQTVSASNSLIGSTADNNVGNAISAFPNGNYVARSTGWDNGATVNVGAITFCNAATNSCAGLTVSASNSLIGSTASDTIGNASLVLTNGNLVLRSTAWDNAAVSPVAAAAGAVTFCHRTAGCPVGVLSAANSLVGTRGGDGVSNPRALTNGNYVVQSTAWDNGASALNAGAVSWCSGTTGCAGAVSASNSLVGSRSSDSVGTATALSNGNYIVLATGWDQPSPLITNAGFALYGNGTTGSVGLPTDAANSPRTVIGTQTSGITNAQTRFDAVNNQLLVGRHLSNAVTVIKFTTTTTTAINNGNWEDPATWNNGLPDQGNHPVIPAGFTVTLNSSAFVTNLTVQAGGSLVFNDDLNVSGNLSIGSILSPGASHTITLGCDATVTGVGANVFIDGNLKKDFCDLGSFTYPVGTTASGNEYSPVSATVTAGVFDETPSSLSVRAVRGNRPGMVAAQSAQRYFALIETEELEIDLVFNYLDADINGTEADYKLYRFTGAASSLVASTLDAGMNKISTAGATDFSDWAIGNVPLVNTAPTITAAASVTKPLGTVASNATIATVTDDESGAGGVEVNVASANPSNGVTISNIVNTNGTITADITTTCEATSATFTLQVSDGSLTANATLNVGTTSNTQPILTYNNPPTISPGDSTTVNPATVSDNGTLSFTVQPGHGLTTAPTVDADGVVSITNAQPSGPHTVTIRATDACGSFIDGSFTLNVGSTNTAPSIMAQAGVTRQAGSPGSNSQIATVGDTESGAGGVTVTVTSANPSSGVTISNIVNTGGKVTADIVAACGASNATFTLQASDGSLAATTMLSITVTADAAPPTVSCPKSITTTVSSGQCSKVVEFTATGDDGCPGVSVSCEPSSGSAFAIGTTTVTCKATDAAGNMSDNCTFTVTVNAPEINVKGNSATIDDGDDMPGAADHTDFGSASIAGGMITRTFTIENTGTSPLSVTAINLSGTNSSDFTLGALTPASPITASSSATFTVTFDPSAGGLRAATVTITSDDCNEGAYDFAIKGTGLVPPTIASQSTVSRERGAGASNSQIATVNDTEDAEESLTVTASGDGDTFGSSATNNGVTISAITLDSKGAVKADVVASCSATNASFTLKVKDSDQLTATTTLTVSVTADTEKPTLSNCPQSFSQNTDANKCTATVTYKAPTVNDNCTGATVSCSPESGATFQKGTTTVTCTATDAAGNRSADCKFTVTVNDAQPPIIACPNNVTTTTAPNQCSATVNVGAATATDNCAVQSITGSRSDNQPLDAPYPKGTTTITWKAADTSGNMATCMQTVTVEDKQAPAIACLPDLIRITGRPGDAMVAVNYAAATASDNCGSASVACNPPSGTAFPTGTTTVTCAATDESGNKTACSFAVTVFDVCMQNDSSPGTSIVFNTRTGDYIFCCGEQKYIGRGTVAVQGNTYSLQHNTGDRRMSASLDVSGNRGSASYQRMGSGGGGICTVTDRDIRNNTCPCVTQ